MTELYIGMKYKTTGNLTAEVIGDYKHNSSFCDKENYPFLVRFSNNHIEVVTKDGQYWQDLKSSEYDFLEEINQGKAAVKEWQEALLKNPPQKQTNYHKLALDILCFLEDKGTIEGNDWILTWKQQQEFINWLKENINVQS